jgi:hypothetical protein
MMSTLRAQIGDPRWRVVDHYDDEGDEPDEVELVDGTRWLLYLHGASSRGVVVRRHGPSIEVRLSLCASVATTSWRSTWRRRWRDMAIR